ncbi:MAG: hypothetical protein AB1734_11665 [Elusimicrobiota bacterium]
MRRPKDIPKDRRVLALISLLPLALFLRTAAWYGYTDDGWRAAFLAGAGLSGAVAAVFALLRVPANGLFVASSLMLLSGAAAFLSGLTPVVAAYKRFQGSVFLLCHVLVRAGLLLAPGLFAGWLEDPYARLARPAALSALIIFAWSLTQDRILFSAALPFAIFTLVFSAASRRTPR